MRPPHSDAASPSIPLTRNPLRQNLAQITIGKLQILIRIFIIFFIIRLSTLLIAACRLLLPPLGGQPRSSLIRRRCRRRRHEEIYLPPPELRVRRDHDDPVAGGGRRRRRGGGLLEDVLGVELQDLRRRDGAAKFLDAAVGVHYSNNVEGPTRQYARNAASERIKERESGSGSFLYIALFGIHNWYNPHSK
ncbi:plant invertase/pectin methylesterase inhibitor [Striga asiatica]|uniref:Plant invertase/pectin methylesterase inhibitor n=1 Tax=Striga asiatica TaxID=4170 RepID=A0A5A7PG98_STRAF|nr:plant invertase/pectin methylesterase inhibitor [Striga asiatica]